MANDTSVHDDSPRSAEGPGLKQAMGPKLLLFFVVGDIIGTTIYALTGKIAAKVGGALWLRRTQQEQPAESAPRVGRDFLN